MNVYVMQLALELGRRGNQVDVFTRIHDPKDPQIVPLGDGARVIHLKAGAYSDTKETLYECTPEFLSNLRAFREAEDSEYDLIHSHYWLSGHVGAVLSQSWNVPHVTTFHTLAKTKIRARAGEMVSERRLSVETRVADRADAIVVSTQEEKDDLVRLYQAHPHKVWVISPGVDLDLFRPSDKAEARKTLGLGEERVIVYVGRIEPLKGLDILLNAVALLEDSSETRLLIVGGGPGDGELGRLSQLASHQGIQHQVTFTGAVSQTDLPDYYNAADVFVLPSHYESFGLAALEAMACGTPVVASRVGGLKTFIESGRTGYLIPWRCPEPFAYRLDMLLDSPALRDMMGKAARTKALEMSWGGVADRIDDFYSTLLVDSWQGLAGA